MRRNVYINIAEKTGSPSALTQEQGNLIYNEILPVIQQGDQVTLDFDQIERMISPFLNNAIGQLYGTYTSEQISDCLIIKGFPDEKKATLNTVISNAKKFYSNREAFNSAAREAFNS